MPTCSLQRWPLSPANELQRLFAVAIKHRATPSAALCSQFLRFSLVSHGLPGAERTFKQLLKAFPGGDRCLAPCCLELAGLVGRDHEELARSAFEAALRFGADSDLVLAYDQYANFERACGNLSRAEAIRWRGVTELS